MDQKTASNNHHCSLIIISTHLAWTGLDEVATTQLVVLAAATGNFFINVNSFNQYFVV